MHRTIISGTLHFILVGVSALAASSCSLFEPDLSPFEGGYTLEKVDGQPLPFLLSSDQCGQAIVDGEMGLTDRVANRRPLYSVRIFVAPACQVLVPPFRGNELLRDFGGWTVRSDRVFFESDDRGDFSAAIKGTSTSGLPGPALTITLDGRAYEFRRTRLADHG